MNKLLLIILLFFYQSIHAQNVGIGITAPQSRLHLNTPSAASYLQITNSTTGTAASNGLKIGIDIGGAAVINQQSGSPLTFYTGSLRRLMIDQSGLVGIGDISPYAQLTIQHSDNYSFPNPGNAAVGGLNFRTITDGEATGITFSHAFGNDAQAGIYVEQSTSFGTKMHFSTTDAYAAGPQARLSIMPKGNIGIGTVNPNSSAAVDIASNDKGILIPRMSSVERNSIASPAKGLLVFDNTANSFFYYSGTRWTKIGSAPASEPALQNSLKAGQNIYYPINSTLPQFGTHISIDNLRRDKLFVVCSECTNSPTSVQRGLVKHYSINANSNNTPIVSNSNGGSNIQIPASDTSASLSLVASSGEYMGVYARISRYGQTPISRSKVYMYKKNDFALEFDQVLPIADSFNNSAVQSMYMSGNYIILGLPQTDYNAGDNKGKAIIYQKNGAGNTWQVNTTGILTASDALPGCEFGTNVFIDSVNSLAISAAPYQSTPGIYVFKRSNSFPFFEWQQIQKISRPVSCSFCPNYGINLSYDKEKLVVVSGGGGSGYKIFFYQYDGSQFNFVSEALLYSPLIGATSLIDPSKVNLFDDILTFGLFDGGVITYKLVNNDWVFTSIIYDPADTYKEFEHNGASIKIIGNNYIIGYPRVQVNGVTTGKFITGLIE